MATPLYTKVNYEEYQQQQRELAYLKMKAAALENRVRELNDELKNRR